MQKRSLHIVRFHLKDRETIPYNTMPFVSNDDRLKPGSSSYRHLLTYIAHLLLFQNRFRSGHILFQDCCGTPLLTSCPFLLAVPLSSCLLYTSPSPRDS